MNVVKEWSDMDTVGAVLFDDKTILALDEKAAVLIDGSGTLVEQWWKEEPSGPHWDAFLARPEAAGWLPVSAELGAAIFDAGHYGGGTKKAVAGVAVIRRLLTP